jgi:hypothetical protein
MAEMSPGTNNRNNPDYYKGMDDRSNFVVSKGARKAYLKEKHLGRLRNQLSTEVLRHSSFSS